MKLGTDVCSGRFANAELEWRSGEWPDDGQAVEIEPRPLALRSGASGHRRGAPPASISLSDTGALMKPLPST